jgi:hypothetical protein
MDRSQSQMLDNNLMENGIAFNSSRQLRHNFGPQAIVVLFYLTQHFLNWPLLRISRMRGEFNFEDFVTIFTSAKCFQTIGLQIYVPDESRPLCFYPYGRSFIFFIDLFRIPASWAPIIIVLVSFLILHGASRLLGETTFFEKSIFVLFFVSPPLWLGFERGNADLLICLLVLFSAYLTSKNKSLLAIWVLVISTLIKFYTFPLMVFVIWKYKPKANKFLLTGGFFALSFVMFTDIHAQHLQQPGSFAFGSPIVAFWINALNSNLNLGLNVITPRVGQLIGILLVLIISIFFLKTRYISSQVLALNKNELQENCFTHFGVVFVTCFLLGMSYDYRLIFSALAGLFLIKSRSSQKAWKYLIACIWLPSLWLSVFSFGLSPKNHLLVQWVGNLFTFITAGLVIAMVIRANSMFNVSNWKWRKLRNA